MCRKCDEVMAKVPESSTPIQLAYTPDGRVSVTGTLQQMHLSLVATAMMVNLMRQLFQGGPERLLEYLENEEFDGTMEGSGSVIEVLLGVMLGDIPKAHNIGPQAALQSIFEQVAAHPEDAAQFSGRLKWQSNVWTAALVGHLSQAGIGPNDKDHPFNVEASKFMEGLRNRRAAGGMS